MRVVLGLVMAASVAACSRAPDSQQPQDAKMEVAPDSAPPNVALTAAPGVAFTYDYTFRLPVARIARIQEEHAQACEKLGINRCRIVGMTYNVSPDDRIVASLSLKLAPELARAFAREGAVAVDRAEGMVAEAEIKGSDVGGVVRNADADATRLAAERARIDRDLASNPRDRSRATLLEQRAAVQRRIEQVTEAAAIAHESLASTPVNFTYQPGPAVRGWQVRTPLVRAVETGRSSLELTLSALLQAVAALGPPLVALSLLWLLWRGFGRRLWHRLRGPIPVA